MSGFDGLVSPWLAAANKGSADEAGQARVLDFGVAQRLELHEFLTVRLPCRRAMALASDPINSPVAEANR